MRARAEKAMPKAANKEIWSMSKAGAAKENRQPLHPHHRDIGFELVISIQFP
jgi:hypothetical protein